MTCQKIVLNLLKPYLDKVSVVPEFKDAKTLLQELMQAEHLALPHYELVEVEGPGHQQKFTVKCSVKLKDTSATGEGLSRRTAEQSAAMKVLKQFNYAEADTISEDNRVEQVKGS